MTSVLDSGGTIVPIGDGEVILRSEPREISILVAREEVTITHARYAAGETVTGPHVHHTHTDAFYVLEGELTFEIGREAETVTVSAGGFVAAPPQVAHSFRNAGDRPARWLTIHAHDGGFAAFMRGIRDGVEVEWDIAAVPAGGGLPASDAIVSPHGGGERLDYGRRQGRLRCALPDLCVVEWDLGGPPHELPFHAQDGRVDTFLALEGALEGGCIRMLSIHTPAGGFADDLRRAARLGSGYVELPPHDGSDQRPGEEPRVL